MNNVEKNLLDLKHSLHQSKANIFFTIGIGGGISIFFGSLQFKIEPLTAFILSVIFAILFLDESLYNFNECEKIQEKIKKNIR